MSFSNKQWPPPTNWQDFELLCLDLWREILQDKNAQKNGRQGQPQCGVDVYGRKGGNGHLVGIQCKGKDSYANRSLTHEDVREAVEMATLFQPLLSEFIIATTASRDEKLQKLAREITEEHKRSGLFSVTIFGWQDIVEYLGMFPKIAERHYGVPQSTTGLKHYMERVLQRPIYLGNHSLNVQSLRLFGAILALPGLSMVILSLVLLLARGFSGFSSSPVLPNYIFLPSMFGFIIFFISIFLRPGGSQFFPLLLGSFNLETDMDGNLFLTRVGGSCSCGGRLSLIAGSEDGVATYTICSRNPEHIAQFDHTLLPEIWMHEYGAK